MPEKILLGIDEVGRGPWAGPLVVGAVILGPEFKSLPEYDQLTDSKKLTSKKREALNTVILERAAATGLGWVSAAEIDRYNLGPALKLAARRAVKQILTQISQNLQSTKAPTGSAPLQRFDEILIDGTINLLMDTPLAEKVTLLPKADFLIKEVSAASIIAKVARDRYMTELADKYPGYAFEKHVGYGTAAHKSALLALGPCPEHRRSFRPIATLIESTNLSPEDPETSARQPRQTTVDLGQTAEQIVAAHLETLHHTILARNFKTKSYEIDIISLNAENIYFTEVKYRKTASRGTPLEQITPKKRQQIRFAAEAFLSQHPEYQNLQPLLAAASVHGSDFRLDGWFTLPE